ncbi:MAG: class I SAM-dependent methyltransferase [Kiloniellales bacterium]|nr:class I SAM-dependent methyltransferase [Kiloniellales bacterium]
MCYEGILSAGGPWAAEFNPAVTPLLQVFGLGDQGMQPFDVRDYWNKRHAKSYGPESVGYIGMGEAYNRIAYDLNEYVFQRALKQFGTDIQDSSVLDIGSGTGFWLNNWNRAGVDKLVGSDLSVVATDHLKTKFPELEILTMDVSDQIPGNQANAFDIVSAFAVLYHIVDDQRYSKALSNIASVLRPGGLLFLSENLIDGEEIRLQHIVHRSRQTIEGLLAQNGFAKVLERPMFVLMNSPVDSRSRLLHRIWGLVQRASRSRSQKLVLPILFEIEKVLLGLVKKGPSTKFLVYRKE